MRDQVKLGTGVSIVGALLLAVPAQAQNVSAAGGGGTDGRDDDAIMVTANRVEQNIQDVPVAITAFAGSRLQDMGIDSAFGIAAQTPSLAVQQFGEGHPIVYTNIRGIGAVDANPINDQSVAIYVDEIYQGASFAGNQQLFDIERAEVLRGPQGTLFGRNTTGGLIHYITRKPTDEFGGYLRFSYGRFSKRTVEAAIGGALIEGVRARLAGQYSGSNGIDRNPITGEDRFGKYDRFAGRLTVELDLGPDLMLTLSGHGYKSDSFRRGVKYYGQQDLTMAPPNGVLCGPADILAQNCVDASGMQFPQPSNTTTYATVPTPIDSHGGGGYAKLVWNPGWGEVALISGYETASVFLSEELGPAGSLGENLFGGRDIKRENFTQELRASGEGSWGNWIVGAFYYNDSAYLKSPFGFDPSYETALLSANFGTVDTDSIAVFGQASWNLTDQLAITGGLRYTDEKRVFDFNGVPNISRLDASELTGTAGIDWKPTDDLLAYLKYSRGFKSGGFGFSPPPGNVADPERLDAYEAGLKTSWFGNSLRVNASAFYYDFKGLQAPAVGVDQSTNPPTVITGFFNLEKVRLYGGELEIGGRPMDNLDLSLALSLLHSKIMDSTVRINDVSVDGNQIPNAPKASLKGFVRYDIPTMSAGTFAVQTDFNLSGKFWSAASNLPLERSKSFEEFNFRLLWKSADRKFNASVYLENAFNEVYTPARFFSASKISGDIPFFSRGFVDTGNPRTWGIQFGVDF